MSRFSTMYDVAFTVEHDYDDPEQIPYAQIMTALRQRVERLDTDPEPEAFGFVNTSDMDDFIVDDSEDEEDNDDMRDIEAAFPDVTSIEGGDMGEEDDTLTTAEDSMPVNPSTIETMRDLSMDELQQEINRRRALALSKGALRKALVDYLATLPETNLGVTGEVEFIILRLEEKYETPRPVRSLEENRSLVDMGDIT